MSLWLVLLTTLALVHISLAAFEPGCSFMNQQCIYNVKLGHEGKCDTASTGSQQSTGNHAGSCCSAVQGDVDNLHSVVNGLVKQLRDVQVQLGLSQNTSDDLKQTTSERDQLLLDLARKEAELKGSQSNLAVLVQRSADLINLMKEELANSTRDLNACRGVLGLKTKPMPVIGTDNYKLHLCTFEHGTCGYLVKGSDVTRWTLSRGSNHIATGPREDHTYGAPSGHYMLMNPRLRVTQRKGTNRTFTLSSPVFESAHAYCIRFWYNMNGHDVRTLKAFAEINGGKGYPIWSSYGNRGQQWHLAEVNMDSEYTSHPFRLVFEASTNAYIFYGATKLTQGEIAVDDIYVYNTSCSAIPTCPFGLRMGDNSSCYTFHNTPQTWYNSSLACREAGFNSHLVSVNSKAEQDFLTHTIKQSAVLSAAGRLGYYTSGNDDRLEGTFDWTDTGTPYISKYTDWHAGQPNNVGSSQNCLLMQYADSNYDWGDVNCMERHPYICEVEIPVV